MLKKIYGILGREGTIGSQISNAFYRLADWTPVELTKENNFRLGKYGSLSEFTGKIDLLVIACGPRDEDIADIVVSNYLEHLTCVAMEIPKNCHVIYISTARVYEGCNTELINENELPLSTTDYSSLHLSIEKCLKDHIKYLTILRPQAVYNYRIFGTKRMRLITNDFPQTLINGNEIILKSTGQALRNFVSSDDIADCILDCYEKKLYSVIHPTGRRTISVAQYRSMVSEVFHAVVSGENIRNFPYSVDEKYASINGFHSVRIPRGRRDIVLDTIELFRGFL